MWVFLGRVVIIDFDENNKLAIELYFSIYDKSFIAELVIASIIATFWTYIIFYWLKNVIIKFLNYLSVALVFMSELLLLPFCQS